MMNSVELPNATLTVSQLCLGTNQFGTTLNDEQAAAICDTFTGLGGNFFDTAHSYGDWIADAPASASERTLGRWLQRQKRSDYVIATKGCEFDYRKGDFALRVTPDLLQQDLLGSLDCLQTEYIDLYWLHRDDPAAPVAVILDALIAHQKAGRIRYFGCSNWSVERIQAAQQYAQTIGHSGFIACQPMWGLAEPDRKAMQQYAPGGYYEDGYRVLHEAGMTMIPYSAQSRGFFSKLDKMGAGAGAEVLAPDVAALYLSEANRRKLTLIQELAARHKVSVNEIVLAYLLCQPRTTIPIVGASSAAQLRDSVLACDLKLDAQELEALRKA